jgi:hypothetical protein
MGLFGFKLRRGVKVIGYLVHDVFICLWWSLKRCISSSNVGVRIMRFVRSIVMVDGYGVQVVDSIIIWYILFRGVFIIIRDELGALYVFRSGRYKWLGLYERPECLWG